MPAFSTNPNPKFDRNMKERTLQHEAERSWSRPGVIISYDRRTNLATVLLTGPSSDQTGDMVRDVPCPVYMGFQLAAPEPGRPCWVDFRGKEDSGPVITHYFNHNYSKYDMDRSSRADTGVPQFMLHM